MPNKWPPYVDHHRVLPEGFLSKFWVYYHGLLDYRVQPMAESKEPYA